EALEAFFEDRREDRGAERLDALVVRRRAGRGHRDAFADRAAEAAADGGEEGAPQERADEQPPRLRLEAIDPPNEQRVADDERRHENDAEQHADEEVHHLRRYASLAMCARA